MGFSVLIDARHLLALSDARERDYVAGLVCRMLDSEEGRRYLRALHPLATADEQLTGIFAACDLEGRTRV